MPFKSKEQERYLQINEPEIYQDWVDKYGHFKGAESFGAENDETIYILKQMDEDKEKGYLVGNEHYIREALDESFYYSMDAWYDDEEKHEKLLEAYETMSIEKICETLGIPLVFSRKGGFYFTSIQGDANIHVPDYVENRAESFGAEEDETTEQMALRAVNIVHLLKREYSIEDKHITGLYDILFDIARENRVDLSAESFGAEAIPIRHSRRLNGYYAIKGYEDASEDGFIYRIYRAPDTNDWFKATVYDDNAMKDNFRKPTSRRLNPSGEMVISNDPPSLLIGAFPKLEDAKRALVFRMIQDGNYHQMMTDGNLKWLLKDYYAESFSAEESHNDRIIRLKREIEKAQEELENVEYCGHRNWTSVNEWVNQDPFSLTVECDECGSHGLAEYDAPTELSWDRTHLAESFGAEDGYECSNCGSHELRYREYDNPEHNGFFCMNCGQSPCGINEIDNKPCTCDIMEYGQYTWLGEMPRTQFPSYIDVEAFKKQEQDKENERLRIVGSKKKLDAIRKAESFGAETPCAVMVWRDGALTECGWWNEKNEPCVYHPDGKEINAESFGAEGVERTFLISVREYDEPVWLITLRDDNNPDYKPMTDEEWMEATESLPKTFTFKIPRQYIRNLADMRYPEWRVISDEVKDRIADETDNNGDGGWFPLSFSIHEKLEDGSIVEVEMWSHSSESFNSYKVAPDLSSYTKAELVSSIAGPQGTAAYDEVVYDPIAQSRLSAESIDSFSPARLIVLGASIGVALGLYNTRGE